MALESHLSHKIVNLLFFISHSKQHVDDFVGESTFYNYLINTFCEMKPQNCFTKQNCNTVCLESTPKQILAFAPYHYPINGNEDTIELGGLSRLVSP